MTSHRPFKYLCDGEGCGRSIGDIGAFLWYHFPPNEDYCPDCFDKLPEEKKLTNKGYTERIKPNKEGNKIIRADKLPEYLR